MDVILPFADYQPGISYIMITYKNHEGRISQRKIRPERLWFGNSEYHPNYTSPQWYMHAYDVDKEGAREFRMNDVLSWDGVKK